MRPSLSGIGEEAVIVGVFSSPFEQVISLMKQEEQLGNKLQRYNILLTEPMQTPEFRPFSRKYDQSRPQLEHYRNHKNNRLEAFIVSMVEYQGNRISEEQEEGQVVFYLITILETLSKQRIASVR